MKIVFLNHFISSGGAERVTSLLAGKMVEKGHEVILMTNLFKPFYYEFNKQVKLMPLFDKEEQACSKKSLFYMIRNTRIMMKELRPDTVIGMMPLMSFVAVLAAVGLPTKVIASDHTSFERRMPFHIRLIRSYVYRFASKVTVLTKADYDYLGGKLPQKIVMPNPLAYPCVKIIGKDRKKNVLAVGRLDDWKVKGFDLLIEAWAMIANKYPDWVLEIAGDGRDSSKETIFQMIAQNEVKDSVHLSQIGR